MDHSTPSSYDTLLSISKIQEQLSALNRKMDIILGKLSNNAPVNKPAPTPAPKPSFSLVSANQPTTINPPSREKMMYQVVCADCKKNCTIPFKPTADRPVYCKECFALRRSGQTPKVSEPAKAPEPVVKSAPVKETKKVVAKKAVVKKKVVVKKVVGKKKK